MNKKIISILLITSISCCPLISCGNSTINSTSTSTSETSENSSTDNVSPSSSKEVSTSNDANFTDAKATVDVNKIISVADIKGKGENAIKAILGEPKDISENIYTYSKDGYTFEITYTNAVCGKLKIIPEIDMTYPGDATNILKVLDINTNKADLTTPSGMIWNNKYDTYEISIKPDDKVYSKLGNINVILEEKYK